MLTTQYVNGAPNWIDLGSPDPGAAVSFYTGLFSWDAQPLGPEAGGYGFFRLGGKTVAAFGPLSEEGVRSSWTLYFQTADADATAKAVEQAGGTVRLPPFDVFTNGRMAGFTDPGGAEFAVWQPRDTKGLDVVTEPGSFGWAELYAPDAAAAGAFYGAVLEWQAQDVPLGTTRYSVLSTSGGGREASLGGIVEITDAMRDAGVTPHWLPYFEVEDADAVVAEAAQLGGKVVKAPQHAEGVGRFAHLADPFGALFAVITSQPRRS
ncbi:VOC family protein [Streptomyces sp. NPDC005722]